MRDAADAAVAAPSGGRHFVRRGPSRRWMTVFCSLLALAALAGVALAVAGIEAVRDSRAGQVVSTAVDPTEPGFEAFLEPTPTLAILHRDGNDLRSIAVLALGAGDLGGSVVVVSPSIRTNPKQDSVSLAAVSGFGGGPEAAMPALQAAIRLGISEVALVDDGRWRELVAPVAPLTVENPSAAGPFAAGTVALAADQVGAFLAARGEGEPPQAAMLRQRAFYRAWIEAVAASPDPAPVPGEVASGLGRFVRGLANGPTAVESVPLREGEVAGAVRYDVDTEAMDALVADLVAFPRAGSPGARIRARVLDGTGEEGHVQAVARTLVGAGVEIVVVGNADRFDYAESEVRYHTAAVRAAASDLVEALSAGRAVEDPRPTDAFDVTIVLGADV